MPDLTASVSVPRLAAIEYPLGRSLGQPGDSAGQRAVLRATLQALVEIQTPGGAVHLPFELPAGNAAVEPVEPPPIARHIVRHPWQLINLLNRNVPR